MPIHGYPGNVITANPTAPTVSSASGVWTTEQQLLAIAAGNWPGYEYPVYNSLRFNSADSAYLNRTPASAGNRKTFTISYWIKRSSINLGSAQYLFAAGSGTTESTWFNISFDTNGSSFDPITVGTWTTVGGVTTAVFRDPSAWYHIVVAIDTTQATASNRCKIYVNGVQQAQSTTTITQNADLAWNNSGVVHYIGARVDSGPRMFFNGYLTEIYNIDGQALDPSSFGLNDPETGVWSPKRYTGTYGTNGFYLPMTTEGQWSGYFDGTGDYASFSPTSALNAGTGDFTLEFWTLHLTSSTYQGYYYGGAVGSINFRRTSSNTIELAHDGITSVLITSTTIPANQWVHVAVTRNSGTVRIFINGVSGGSVTYTGNFNSTGGTGTIGSITPSIYNLNGYISNLRLITGTALYTANFTPPTAQLTAVSGTQLLTCQSSTFVDNSTNAFTITAAGDARPQQFSPFADSIDDRSGQGNHWIPNNLDLRTTGAGADILVDTPTSYGTDTGIGGEVRGNYCTLNGTSIGANATLSNGNLDISYGSSATRNATMGTFGMSSGKWYWETTIVSLGTPSIGITNTPSPSDVSNYPGFAANGWSYLSDGTKYNSGTGVAYGATYTTNDVIGVAFDADTRELTFYKNGVSQGVAYTGLAVNTYFPAFGDGSATGTWSGSTNFGQRPFQKWNGSAFVANTAPSGFKALCTQNLPPVTIGATSTTQAGKYFNAVTYTGNGVNQASGGQAISGVGFQPDWLWLKSRGTANNHILTDAVRGIGVSLSSDANVVEYSTSDDVLSFNANGFTVASDGTNIVNGLSVNYVGWNWNAGGSNQTISVGQYATSPANVPSIASTVRANTTSGFSIVTFTTNNTAGATVGHGCQVGGVATTPDMIIMKYRGLAANWVVYHKSMNATPQNGYLNLNTSAPYAALIDPWNNTAPSSTVITMGAGAGSAGSTNYSVYTSVAYCFAAVPGYSAFGSYAGNGTTTGDGPFIYTGFKPAFVMLKAYIGSGENWAIYDKSRIGYNSSNYVLFPNLTNVENAATTHIDLLSNGFKLRSGNQNLSSYSYIYAAFAEHPFKYSLAR